MTRQHLSAGRLAPMAVLLVALALAVLLPGRAEAAFAQRKILTIDFNQVPGPTNLVDFPVLVSITGDNSLKTTGNGGLVTSSTGDDIVFRAEDATTCSPAASPCVLDHEIELYDGLAGTLVAWVRVPTLRSIVTATNTVIYMYYGDAAVTCPQENPGGVWDSGYREVFHLDESGDHEDSTQNAFGAARRGATGTTLMGKIGPAISLQGTASGAVEAEAIASDGSLAAGSDVTFESWVNFNSYTAGNYMGVVVKGRECLYFDGSPDTSTGCPANPCGDWYGLYNRPSGGVNRFALEFAYGGGCKAGGLPDARAAGVAQIATGTWYHVAGTLTGGTRRLFVNGQQVATDAVGACIVNDIPQYTRFGTDSNGTYSDALIDEVRVSTVARSGDWIQTGFNNQNAPGTFFLSIVDDASPPAVTGTCSVAVNPCAGGAGSCNLRSIGDITPYSAGTVTATSGSDTVTGASTGWQSANRGRGDRINIQGANYMVLSVDNETTLRLTTPYGGAGGSGLAYTMSRQFTTLQDWENCISGGAACPYGFTVAGGNLVTGNRSEIGVVYDDGASYVPAVAGTELLLINGSTTDEAHTITLTVDPGNRHLGIAGAGVVLDNGTNSSRAVVVQDQFVTVEWLEIDGGGSPGSHCLDYVPSTGANQAVFRNNLIRNCSGQSVRLTGSNLPIVADITNNFIYGGSREGIKINTVLGTGAGSRVRILNNTLYRTNGAAGSEITTVETPNPYVTLRNNIFIDGTGTPNVQWDGGVTPCTYGYSCPWWNATSGPNLSADTAPPTGPWQPAVGHSPRGGGIFGATEASLLFADTTPGSENLHLQTGSAAWSQAADLSGLVSGDIDAETRTAPWDLGADELPAAAATPLIVYSDFGASALRFSTYQGGVWSAGTVGVTDPAPAGGTLHHKTALTRPDGTLRAALLTQHNPGSRDYFRETFWDGTNWDDGTGAPYDDTYTGYDRIAWDGVLNLRAFDAAYEQQSGRLLTAVGINTVNSIKWNRYNGAWTAPTLEVGWGSFAAPYASIGYVSALQLAARPASNQIAYVGMAVEPAASPTAGAILGGIWDGNSGTWGSKQVLSFPSSGQTATLTEAVDIEYVLGGTNFGEAVAVWGNGQTVQANTWSSGSWLGTSTTADLGAGNNVRWVRLAAQPYGPRMVMAIEDSNQRLLIQRYDGTTRTFPAVQGPFTSALFGSAASNRPFDIAWYGANNVMLVYSDGTGIRWRQSTNGGGIWNTEQTLTGSFQAYWIQMQRDPSGNLHLVVHDQADDLRAWVWDGTAWAVTTPTPITLDLERFDAARSVESFDIASYPPSGAATTAVELMAFEATPADQAVDLQWQTASELDNLGFHLYRSTTSEGPWTRLTSSLIPGLGSSPVGASYSWHDTGLQNGTTYFYMLEDVDTASVSTLHGPVSVVPLPGTPPPPGGSDGGGDPGTGGTGSETDPTTTEVTPVGSLPACSDEAPVFPCVETYGDPEAVSVRLVSRRGRRAVVELTTGGFFAVRDASGRVRLSVPGFEDPDDPHAPALPLKRVVLPAAVGLRSRVAAVASRDEVSYPGLLPAAVGYREMDVREDGTIRPGWRAAQLRDEAGTTSVPVRAARLSGTAFLGEDKRLALEMMPLRYDPARGSVVLARRLRVTIRFAGRAAGETGRGTRGRRRPRSAPGSGETLAHLYTTSRGVYALPFETLFPGRQRPLSLDVLRLQQGERVVPFHVEPDGGAFGPRSVLYFYADREAASTDFTGEVAWELVRAGGGVRMTRLSAAPSGAPLAMASLGPAAFEVNRIYQSGLLDADDRWLWENLIGGSSGAKTKSFDLPGVDTSATRPARLTVLLQGGSDAEGVVDHHVRVTLNGVFVGETVFDARLPHRFGASVPASVLHEGSNDLTVENVGDTGVYSLVFLDRFSLDYPQRPALRDGRFDGIWDGSGTVEIGGVTAASPSVAGSSTTRRGGASGRGARALGTLSSLAALDVTDAARPRWLVGLEPGISSVRLRAEAGHRYALVTPDAALTPRVAAPWRSSLRSTSNRADYILIAPSDFLGAAQPLLDRRAAQGLRTRAVALEEIASTFGGGSPSGEAIRDFLAYAYHSWRQPSPRYVLLLGDASQDPRNFTGTANPAPLPGLFLKTSYLWTVSDPALAAVNGDDLLPDIAIGRLPAQTASEASALVAKVLAWEDSGQGLSGEPVIVADNPDAAGDFEADARDIAEGPLAGRSPRMLFLSQLGPSTRGAIVDALDDGVSTISYVGHGGTAVWASENVLNSWDTGLLQAQSTQPLMLTMNCLNGYFVAPTFDSLSEAFLKAEGRGTIAAFSPSGLSVDEPAHFFHRALVTEIEAGHRRLGDAVLAAQRDYAESGHMPELLSIYQLLGDPAMELR